MTVSTIGHSTHPIEEFIRMLEAYGIRQLVDVRTIPRSRRNPQFNRENLPASLRAAGIGYTHMPSLGGLRHARKDSVNTGWRNASFRGYADYMQTPEFSENLKPAHPTRFGSSHRDHVRRGCSVAVSPIADCGRAGCARNLSVGNLERDQVAAARHDAVRKSRRPEVDVSGCSEFA